MHCIVGVQFLGGVSFKNVEIASTNKVTLRGWWLFPPSTATTTTTTPTTTTTTIIYFHGNAGNIGHCLPKVMGLLLAQPTNVNILLVDYRGYGDSDGVPSEAGLISDGLAMVNYALECERRNLLESMTLRSRTDDQDKNNEMTMSRRMSRRRRRGNRGKLVLMGQSLGGAVVVGVCERLMTVRFRLLPC